MPRQLHFLGEGVLVLAAAADSGRHAHRAVQLLLALDLPVWLERAGGNESCRFAALAPQEPHRVRGQGQPIAHLFIDPGPAAWQRWLAEGHQAVEPDSALLQRLRAEWQQPDPAFDAEDCFARWRHSSLPGLREQPPPDRRIAAAKALIDADPTAAELDHRSLAQRVHLSPSRFLALFPQHTGMPVRHYLLWRRLLLAMALLRGGRSVTEAALAAGFADGPHFSRSVRKVLGASPSEIRLPVAEGPGLRAQGSGRGK